MQLVVNTGSTSKKYALYSAKTLRVFAHFEAVDTKYAYTLTRDGQTKAESISKETYDGALTTFLAELAAQGLAPSVVGVRIVAPGTFFTKHRHIDATYIQHLEAIQPYAPLHITPALAEIQNIRRVLPRIKMIGASDSAFHCTIPDAHKRYSIPKEDAESLDIYRFGYHGLSVASVMRRLPDVLLDAESPKTIVCHVGGGVSVTALKNGQSIDTSMGFSPVSGLHMGTRTGDIDPGALMYVAERKNFNLDQLRAYINTEGGLRGVYGASDMREVLKGYEANEPDARLAIEMFSSRIKKHIGAGIALLGGLDTLVLTATAVERNSQLRSLLLEDLEHFGIALDEEKNTQKNEGENRAIQKEGGKVTIAVVHTDEMEEIAAIADSLS